LVQDLGLTGTPFMNVYNGCATGGSALLSGANAIASGMADLVLVIGFDKHERGAFATNPAEYGIGEWFGEMGMMVTTQFFGMKIQRYLDQYDLDPRLLAELSAKALRNGARNPNAWRRHALSVDEIADAEWSTTRSPSTCSAVPARARHRS
jgi:acetyl-CoA acetyltransferase